MRIRRRIPKNYGGWVSLRESNDPIAPAFTAFLRAIYQYGERHNLSGHALLGSLAMQLNLPPFQPSPTPSDKDIVLDVMVDDPQIEALYEQQDASDSVWTGRIIRLMLRMQEPYQNDIDSMIYAISQVDEQLIPSAEDQTVREPDIPEQTIRTKRVSQPRPEQTEEDRVDEPPVLPVPPVRTKRVKRDTPLSKKTNKKPTKTPKQITGDETPDRLDELLERMDRMQRAVQETTDAVETNPLLNDFL